MKLTLEGLQDQDWWKEKDIQIPTYDISAMRERTKENPIWVHFGIGNIFRIFIGGVADKLLAQGAMDRGITCVEAFDYDVIDKIYRPFDNLVLGVTLHADGHTGKQVTGALAEAIAANPDQAEAWERLLQIFTNPSLQMVSFTITEKGYALTDASGQYFPFIRSDIQAGPDRPRSAMAVLCALLHARFAKNAAPVAVVSMDNCSHNGEKLKKAVLTMAEEWEHAGFVEHAFLEYLSDEKQVSFPWTMIDKITPRPADSVAAELKNLGLEDMDPVVTEKHTYIAPFVNAESTQYLVVEDRFPNGRPPLEKAGVYMTTRETVNKMERMKVTTCLNPLHTALAVYGCVLGYTRISDEMQDPDLVELIRRIGLSEGMPVVTKPEIVNPAEFVQEVMEERLPNPFIPDTPQRIACDTSQKVGIRYGVTIASYVAARGTAQDLEAIPLAIAGWCRYLLGIDDQGNPFTPSPDPMLSELNAQLATVKFGHPESYQGELKPILSNTNVFGSDLYQAGLGDKIEAMFLKEIAGPGAVRKTLDEYMQKE